MMLLLVFWKKHWQLKNPKLDVLYKHDKQEDILCNNHMAYQKVYIDPQSLYKWFNYQRETNISGSFSCHPSIHCSIWSSDDIMIILDAQVLTDECKGNLIKFLDVQSPTIYIFNQLKRKKIDIPAPPAAKLCKKISHDFLTSTCKKEF